MSDETMVGSTWRRVRLERRDGIAYVTLHNPDRANALDGTMLAELACALTWLANAPSIVVAVLGSDGPMFCPGADVAWLAVDEPGMDQRIDVALDAMNVALAEIRNSSVILVAAVHGSVAGGGIGLVCAADLVIAADDTLFTLAYGRLGATPDLGTTWKLPRLVGERRALELMALSDRFDAARAHALGLVNFVVPAAELSAHAQRLAQRLADAPPAALAATKRLTYAAAGNAYRPHLQAERDALVAAARGGEFPEGLRAYRDRRAPNFPRPRPA